MKCEACERGDHDNCGMQTWCECDCEGYDPMIGREQLEGFDCSADFCGGLSPAKSPPCRVCHQTAPVICYPDDHAQTICPDCCDTFDHADTGRGHDWKHNPHERDWECQHCGILKRCTKYCDEGGGSEEWAAYPA